MNKCSINVKRSAVTFVRKIKGGVSQESSLAYLYSGLSTENPTAIAELIYAAAVLPAGYHKGIAKNSSTSEELTNYITENSSVVNPAGFDEIAAIPGMSTVEELADTIKTKIQHSTAQVVIEDELNIFGEEAKYNKESSGQVNINLVQKKELALDNIGLEMAKNKARRVIANEGLSANSTSKWTNFLSIYFPGSNYGADFTIWAQNTFYDAMINHSSENTGFMTNVNLGVNEIKERISNKKKSYKATTPYSDIPHIKQFKEDAPRLKYFHEVMDNEFDFILSAMMPILSVSPKETVLFNSKLSGLTDIVGSDFETIVINADPIRHRLVAEPGKPKDYTPADNINKILTSLPLDSNAFIQDDSIDVNAFYILDNDGTTWFVDEDGLKYDVTPISRYSYAFDSKRNQDSIDHYINPMDQGTDFINSIFPMMRYVETRNDGLAYGERMKKSDFLSISPYLLDAGRTIDELRERLIEIKNEKGRNYKIAQSLLVHIFDPNTHIISRDSDVSEVHSLMHKVNRSEGLYDINEDIIKALYSALVSKEFTKRIAVVEGKTDVSKPLGRGTEANLVNDSLSAELIAQDNRTTKKFIANHLKVIKDDVMILNTVGDVSGPMLSNISDMTSIKDAMDTLGLRTLFNRISDTYTKNIKADQADNMIIGVSKDIIAIAAANINTKIKENRLSIDKGTIFPDKGFRYISPSTIIASERLKDLAEVFHPETTKNILVAGEKVNPMATPNRDAYISTQIDRMRGSNDNVNSNRISFLPFLLDSSDTDTLIPAATHHGTFIKTATLKDGKAIGVSDWNMRVRIEHAMIHGMIEGPKSKAGNVFYLQPINYSDKSAIEMHEIRTKVNLLKMSTKDLAKSWVEYNTKRYEQLQLISIEALTGFIGGQYEIVKQSIIDNNGTSAQLNALQDLRDMLVNKEYPTEGDMTRPINALLGKAKIDRDAATFNDTTLDKDADYVQFKQSKNDSYVHLFLKPHLGVRAAAFRADGIQIARDHILENRRELKQFKVSSKDIKKSLKGNKITKHMRTDEFYDKFFLINGILAHPLKVMTMGDESYFKGFYKDSMSGYYAKVDSGETTGLEEVSTMIQSQFKRAQSELTRGVLYAQQETLVGIKRAHRKNNLTQHLDITTEFNNGLDVLTTYSFKELHNKTYSELEAMDILVPFEDGSLISIDPNDEFRYYVNFRLGDDIITLSNEYDNTENFEIVPELGINMALYKGLYDLIDADRAGEVTFTTGPMKIGVRANSTEGNLLVSDVLEAGEAQNVVVMPDFIPSITVSDPSSNINLLADMDISQDNSDAIQFMHPLLALINDSARGGKFGAFHTENNEALKTVTTTFEYDRFRQILQKKSVQNPFSFEQMKKTAGVELYNVLNKLNTSIEFKQKNMMITEYVDGEPAAPIAKNFNNLAELFEYFGGYVEGDQVWHKVLGALKENPANMYSFVGLITVPSNQKTGHKRLNKWDDIFSARANASVPVIDYTGNEYNFEVLTKAHEYDVTSSQHASTIALLSQLVNATSFGGLSKVPNNILQNSMASVMEVSRLRSGDALSNITRELELEARAKKQSPKDFRKVVNRLSKGDPSVDGYTDRQMDIYKETLGKGIEEMAQLAFNEELDSMLIKDIIEGPDLSLDTPAIMSKVIGTIRSALFKDTVKMKMSGYIGTVSATHNTVKMFDLPNGVRRSRAGFISGALEGGLEGVEGQVVTIDQSNIETAMALVLPYDDISVDGQIVMLDEVDMRAEFLAGADIKVVYTPDILYVPAIQSMEQFEALDDNLLIKVKGDIMFKWYYLEDLETEAIQSDIDNDNLEEDITERYSLRWYDIDASGINLQSSKAYRDFYRAQKVAQKNNDPIKPKEKDRLMALLVLETQKKNDDGTSVYRVTSPEVVLPTFMGEAYNIPKGTSLSDIIGTDGNDLVNAKKFFERRINYRGMKKEDTRFPVSRDKLLAKYTSKVAFTNEGHVKEILTLINTMPAEMFGKAELREINKIITSTKESHLNNVSKDFLKSLKTVLTRIPGQSKQSGFTGRVVELLDGQGNATFAPTAHLTNTGGDLDIDTLSVLTKTIDRTGRIFGYSEFTNDNGFDMNKLLAAYKLEIFETGENFKLAITEHNRVLNEEINLLKMSVEGLEGEEIDPVVTDKLEKRRVDDKKQRELIIRARNKVSKRYENILSNAIEDGIYKSLSNIDTMVEVNTPISMDMVKAIPNELPKDDFTPNVHGESYMPIFIYEELSAQGKESIGVFATVLKVNSAIQTSKNVFDEKYASSYNRAKTPFVFKNVLEYYDVVDGKNVKHLQTGFSDLDRFGLTELAATDPEVQKIMVAALEGQDVSNEWSKNLVKIIIDEVNSFIAIHKGDSNLNDVIRSKSKTLLGIELTTKNPLAELKRKLKKPEVLSAAFANIIGKQLSNDVQSQFLSAATDNAKELILGKIKSNALTNSLITSMMLLNHDATSIIRFLFDPQIVKVLEYYDNRKGELEKVRITKKDLTNKVIKGVKESSPAIKSLIRIMEISDEIAKFRSVRSLNENFKIEQYKLDKILEDLDSHVLYKAIIDDTISLIKDDGAAQKVFNPNMMVFLHPQSRTLFKNLYEAEMFKIPALFKSSRVLRNFLVDNRDSISYKNAINHLSGALVESYLITPIDGKPITGALATKSNENHIITHVELNNDKGRERFVEAFPEYIEYTTRQMAKLNDKINSAIPYFGYTTPYGSSISVLNIPILKHMDADPIDIAVIHSGIEDLLTDTGDSALNAVQKELYTNLGLYSLITSNGQVKKGSMIELFSEINEDVAKHIKKLSEEDFYNMFPESLQAKLIMLNKVPTLEGIRKGIRKGDPLYDESEDFNRAALAKEEAQEAMAQYEVAGEVNEDDIQAEFLNLPESHKIDLKKAANLEKTIKYAENKVYKIIEETLEGAIFLGTKTGKLPYRIFSKPSVILPINSTKPIISFTDVSDDVVRDIHAIGKQIGMDAKYEGKDVKILAYAGKQTAEGSNYHTYLISSENMGERIAPGPLLMDKNSELFLYGNIIEKRNSFNNKYYDQEIDKINAAAKVVPRSLQRVEAKKLRGDEVARIFTAAEIHSNDIVKRETLFINSEAGGAKYILTVNKLGALSDVVSYKAYHSSELDKAIVGSRKVLIPAFKSDKRRNTEGVLEDIRISEINEMKAKVVTLIDDLLVGEDPLIFYGLMESGLEGGAILFQEALANSKGFKVLKEASKDVPSMIKYTVNRRRKSVSLIPVNKNIHTVELKKNPDNGIITIDRGEMSVTDFTQASLKALTMGITTVPHKIIKLKIGDNNMDSVVFNAGQSDQRIYVINEDNSYNDKYYEVVSEPSMRGDTFEFSDQESPSIEKKLFVSRDMLSAFNSTINKDSSDINNKACK